MSYVMDAGSESKLVLVCPKLADLVRQVAESMELLSQPVRIIDAVRPWSVQAALWAQGRTSGGPIVTNARPGASYHQFGMAVDLGIISLLDQPGWAENDPLWEKMGNIGESLGLFWGGRFVHLPDKPHFQLTGRFPESPNDEVRQIFLDQGMSAVWREAGLD